MDRVELLHQLPNALSLLRLVLTVPIVAALLAEQQATALVLGVLALISDALDGIIARRYQAQSELGLILDPLADKVLAAAVATTLTFKGALPLWYAVVVIGRDALIGVASLMLSRRIGSVPPSLPAGKAAATGIGVVLLSAIAGVPRHVLTVLAVLSCVLLAWSLVVYGARVRRFLRQRDVSNERQVSGGSVR